MPYTRTRSELGPCSARQNVTSAVSSDPDQCYVSKRTGASMLPALLAVNLSFWLVRVGLQAPMGGLIGC